MAAASHATAQTTPAESATASPRMIPLPSQQTRGTVPPPQSGAPRETAQRSDPDDRNDDRPQFSSRHDSRSSRREEREYRRERPRRERDGERQYRRGENPPRRGQTAPGSADFGDSAGAPVWLDRACAPDRDQRVTAYVAAIEQKTTPTGDQLKALEELKKAATSAGELLRAGCEGGAALTPTRQVEVVERRAKAIISAIDMLKPALEGFYASLDDEQKARFVTLATPSDTPSTGVQTRSGDPDERAQARGRPEEASEPPRKKRRGRRYRSYRW